MSRIEHAEDGKPLMVVPFRLRHLGYRQTIVLDRDGDLPEIANEPLAKAIILAHQYAEMLESGKYTTVLELARKLRMDRSYVARTLSLVNLAPDIVTKVMQGKAPESLSLAKATSGFPDDWQEQRKLFQME